jgi:hypothetical protein
MFGNVTVLGGLHVTILDTKHDAHTLQACGLGSSQYLTLHMFDDLLCSCSPVSYDDEAATSFAIEAFRFRFMAAKIWSFRF